VGLSYHFLRSLVDRNFWEFCIIGQVVLEVVDLSRVDEEKECEMVINMAGIHDMVYFDFLWMIRINRYQGRFFISPCVLLCIALIGSSGHWPILRAASKHWCMIVEQCRRNE